MLFKKTVDSLLLDSMNTSERALKAIAEAEKYLKQSYEGRFFFELIQNARDANKEIDSDGIIHITLENGNLTILNSGAPFSIEGVKGITTIGQSTKHSQDYIGFKGIGFKSILEITDTPKIITEYGSVFFDKEVTFKKYTKATLKDTDIPLFYFPYFSKEKLTDQELKNKIATKIQLPLKNNISDEIIINSFSLLKPEQLVLLGNIAQIFFKSKNKQINYIISKNKNTKLIEVNKNEQVVNSYKKFTPSKPVIIPQNIISGLDQKEKNIFKNNAFIDVNIVLKLDNKKRIKMLDEAKLYLFYPLKISSGFRFIIHSYFIVNPERTALRDSEFNNFLLSSIGSFIGGEMLKSLKRNKANTTIIFCFKRNNDANLDSLYDSLVAKLNPRKFIYDTRTKKYFLPSEVIVADNFNKKVFPDGKLGNKYLIYIKDKQVIEWLQNEFHVPYLTNEEIKKGIEKECRRQLKKKNFRYFQDLYNYIRYKEDIDFSKTKILLTSDRKLVSSQQKVFYGGNKNNILLSTSIKKYIYFLHREIKISDLREGRSKIGITEFNTYELIKKLLILFKEESVSNVDIINALYSLYPFDLKSELEVRKDVVLPIKGNKEWLSPIYNPIYIENDNLQELYPEGKYINKKIIFKGNMVKKHNIDAFFKMLGAWEIPAVYLSPPKELRMIPSGENRNRQILKYSSLSLKPFYLINDRLIDIPEKFNNWFTQTIFSSWDVYKEFITSGSIPKLRYCNSRSDKHPAKNEIVYEICEFIEVLSSKPWIILDNKTSIFYPCEIIGISPYDFKQPQNRVISKYLDVLPINYAPLNDFFDLTGIIHLNSNNIIKFQKILNFVYKKYKDDIPANKDFIDFYNRLLSKLVELCYNDENWDISLLLKNIYFLAVNDITQQRCWKKANQIFHIDDKASYEILPNSIKEKVQPHFTKRDKNTFGKIATKIGKCLSKTIRKELVKSEVIISHKLVDYCKYIPECIAILESQLDTVLNKIIPKISLIRILVCRELEVKIYLEDKVNDIIPVNYFVDKNSQNDVYFSELNSTNKNEQIAKSLNELFTELLGRDLGRFKSDIQRFFNSSEKDAFKADYEISTERIREIKYLITPTNLTEGQLFWEAILNSKKISNAYEAFNEDKMNFSKLASLLKVDAVLLGQAHMKIDFHCMSNPNNIKELGKLFSKLFLSIIDFNNNLYQAISFKKYYEGQLNNLRNKFEDKFNLLLYNYLKKLNIEKQSAYQNVMDSYKYHLGYYVPHDSLELDVYDFFLEKINEKFPFLKINKQDILLNADQLQINQAFCKKLIQNFSKNQNLLKEKLKKMRYSESELCSFLAINRNRSLLYFGNVEHLGEIFAKRATVNRNKNELQGILNKFDDLCIEQTNTRGNQVLDQKNHVSSGRIGRRYDGGAVENDKIKLGKLAEMLVFKKLGEKYKNVIWVSKYASKIPHDSLGYNPEGQDGLGYDIEYLDLEGNKYFVEVKGRSNDIKAFEITENELAKAYTEKECYKIIFVSNLSSPAPTRIIDLGNLFILEEGEDFFSNSKFSASYKNFEIHFQESFNK